MVAAGCAARAVAAEGCKLEAYYVQPLCSPTRGTIMTGRCARADSTCAVMWVVRGESGHSGADGGSLTAWRGPPP
jgi:arylsulfatase A-like enzyme